MSILRLKNFITFQRTINNWHYFVHYGPDSSHFNHLLPQMTMIYIFDIGIIPNWFDSDHI